MFSLTFPGLSQVVSAQFVLTHGISPSVCTIQCAPQPATLNMAPGRLEFQFGGTRLRFADCIIDDFSASVGPLGHLWTLSILDRRWRWRFAEPISGHYNQRLDNGELARGNAAVKRPQELAKLCLAKMGEANADVSELPNETLPEVDWDFANPAEALAQLCESLGCRIVLQLNDRVAIRRIGRGRPLPNTPDLMEDSLSLDLQARPDAVWCVTAPARYQADFRLEPVGLDTDGQVKPIDELSYRPAAGWAAIDLAHFHNLANADADTIRPAKATVFKWYRIIAPSSLPGYGPLAHGIHQILLEETQVAQTTDSRPGTGAGQPRQYNKPAQVHGVWFKGDEDLKNTATSLTAPTADTKTYSRGFVIDRDRKLVKFAEQVIRNTNHTSTHPTPTSVSVAAGDLVLRTACTVLQAGTLAVARHVRRRKTGQQTGGAVHQVRREDLILGSVPQYASNAGQYSAQLSSGTGVATTSNLAEINRQADLYIDAALADFAAKVPQARTYAGLKEINPDGAIQQVAWFLGPQGAITRASRNNEQVDLSLSFQQRRFTQRLHELLKREQKNAAQAKRERRRTG